MTSDTYPINEHPLVKAGYIPLDKSWMIRMGVLDMVHQHEADIISFLEKRGLDTLGEDIHSLYESAQAWNTGMPVPVHKAGTLYRFLKFAAWLYKTPKEFIIDEQLRKRPICNDPSIIDWTIERLQHVPGDETSQWASAAILLRGADAMSKPDPKNLLTYEARDHWYSRREQGLMWEARYDTNILGQAQAFLELLHTGKTSWRGNDTEDYGPALAFEALTGVQYITAEQKAKWKPKLDGQESVRTVEIPRVFAEVDAKKPIDSDDHRVIYSGIMYALLKDPTISLEQLQIAHPDGLNKSWPESLKFFRAAPSLDQVLIQ